MNYILYPSFLYQVWTGSTFLILVKDRVIWAALLICLGDHFVQVPRQLKAGVVAVIKLEYACTKTGLSLVIVWLFVNDNLKHRHLLWLSQGMVAQYEPQLDNCKVLSRIVNYPLSMKQHIILICLSLQYCHWLIGPLKLLTNLHSRYSFE